MNFSIKDLLMHIFHGGVVLAILLYVLYTNECDCLKVIVDAISPNAQLLESLGVVSLLIAISYIVGIFLDPVADYVDRKIFCMLRKCLKFPSYYLLNDRKKEGKKWKKGIWGFTLAHNKIVNDILIKDVLANKYGSLHASFAINDTVMSRWRKAFSNPKWIDCLFQYAKNRAFSKGNVYQIQRIEAYFRLSSFFRTVPVTLVFSFIVLCFLPQCSGCVTWYILGLIVVIVVSVIAFLFNYRYRIYYCRMVLGAVYTPRI